MNQSQTSTDNNERLVRVEENLKTLIISQAKTEVKVDALYDAFTQAKGARWLFIVLWVSVGALLVNIKTLMAIIGFKIGS